MTEAPLSEVTDPLGALLRLSRCDYSTSDFRRTPISCISHQWPTVVRECDRAARVARGLALAERTFANREKAARWLHRNLGALGGRTPMDLIRTDAGARVVEGLVARISWGAAA